MKKIVIMPYFGKFPNYFDLWLHSCEVNLTTDWMIVTNNAPPAILGKNIRWIQKSLSCLQQEFQNKLGMKVWLKNPYKLCDFKGFYGFLFSEYLEGYDFWGYCDCDVIFGDIDKFLPEQLFRKYDKLLRTGHLSFVRNTKKINENFLKYDTYKVVLKSPVIYGYDEAVDGYRKGFAGELLAQGYKVYQNDALPADIDFRHFPFRVVTEPNIPCVFRYQDGKVFRIFRNKERVVQEEVIYLHLQKRKMVVREAISVDDFLVYPNVFTQWQDDIVESEEFWHNASTEVLDYYNVEKEIRNERIRDIRRWIYEPKKIACLWYRFGSK